ncbi:MAG: thiamine-phosphate kinase [Solirubrobacterales bacterium]
MSEFDLIDRLKQLSSSEPPVLTGIGDDASVTVHDGPTATSVDAVVEGVHFSREWASPLQIAQKAVGTALSDIAAMAAEVGEVYVTLGVPAETSRAFLEELADGFAEVSASLGAVLAGGDTVASPVMFVSVTAVGRAPAGEQLILRSGAAEGDLVAVTGEFGGASAGLILLGHPEFGEGGALAAETRQALVLRQLAPQPRLAVGRALRGSGVSALIDVSDGLAADLGHVARSSGVAIELDQDRIPVQAGVLEIAEASGRSVADLVLAGGEDYELAFTLPPAALATVEERLAPLGCRFGLIGEVRSGSGVTVTAAGHPMSPPEGFDHFG